MNALRAAAVGAWAALRTPAWLTASRMQLLMAPPAPREPVPPPRAALRASRAALRMLGYLPRSPWRNTCLYRSVAECLLLRAHGAAAMLRIGVRPDERGGEILAHAWVVHLQPDGTAIPTADDRLHALLILR